MLNIDDINLAAERLKGRIVETPLLESLYLNEMLGGRILFKAECLQRTGSFKIRGATNKLLSLKEQERKNGVVAYSSGNHAQGVAAAARSLDIKATIVIPRDAPQLKIDNTRADGATIVLYDRENESRELIAKEIAEKQGSSIVAPYDDLTVIAGQGVVGLEVLHQLEALKLEPDIIFCPCGGGGLIAGLSTAIKSRFHDTEIFAVEPQDFDDTKRSLEAGERVKNKLGARSICDAILTPIPGEITFEINRRLLTGGISVSDEAVVNAIVVAYSRLKLAVEPGAAVGLAALLSGEIKLNGKTAIVVLSGGNIDLKTMIELMPK